MNRATKIVTFTTLSIIIAVSLYMLYADHNSMFLSTIVIVTILCTTAFMYLTQAGKMLRALGIKASQWYSSDLGFSLLCIIMLAGGIIIMCIDTIPTKLAPHDQAVRDTYISNGIEVDIIIIGKHDVVTESGDVTHNLVAQYLDHEGNVIDAVVIMASSSTIPDDYEQGSAYVLPDHPNYVYLMPEDTRLDVMGYGLCYSAMLILICILIRRHRQVNRTEMQIEPA